MQLHTDPMQHEPASRAGDLLDASALEQARAIREGHVSSVELTRGYLARIAAQNPQLHAFVEVAYRRAPRWAAHKDRERRQRGELPPFHGVPIGIKDLNIVRGFRARFGSRALRYLWGVTDDLTVRSLKRAGFVILGKLATSEAGAMPVTEPDIHPPTRNPWDPTRTPGGSSGGSAAAVAAGLLPLAHGSDGAGSIRIPASFCNLFGFKPSRGRVRNPYGHSNLHLLYTCGTLTRSVSDAAALLDAMTNGERPPASFAAGSCDRPRPLRILYSLHSPFGAADPEPAGALQRVLRLLEAHGHHVAEGPQLAGSLDEFLPLWQALIASAPLMRGKLQPITRWIVDGAKHLDKRSLLALHARLEQRVDAAWGDADILVTPTVACLPPRIGAFTAPGVDPEAGFRAAAVLGGFTAPFNVTGQPAASIPAGFSETGLPIGVQLVGRRMQDAQLLALARQLEPDLPFRRRPERR